MVTSGVEAHEGKRSGAFTTPTRWIAIAAASSFLIVQLLGVWRTLAVKTVGDIAMIEMETRRVLSGSPPLLGAYSRYGWRHPGGILFWVWSPVYELAGASSKALSSAAAVLVAFTIWWVTRRLPRQSGFHLAVLTAVLLLVATIGPDGAAHPWNPTATLAPFVAVLASAAAAWTCDAPLIAAITTGTWWLFVFETHGGTGIVLLPAVLITGIVVIVRLWRGDHALPQRRPLALSVVVALTVAAPMLIDTLAHRGGNLRLLIGWSRANDAATTPLSETMVLLGRASSLSFLSSPPQPHFLFPVTLERGLLPGALFVVVILAAVLCYRQHNRLGGAALSVVVITWLSAVLAVSAIPTPVYFWLVLWLQPLAWTTWAVSIWIIALAVGSRVGRIGDRLSVVTISSPRARQIAGIGSAALLSALAAWGSGSPVVPTDRTEFRVNGLADLALMVADQGRIEVRAEVNSLGSEALVSGVLNELDRRGVAACAGPEWEFKVSKRWRCSLHGADTAVLVHAVGPNSTPPVGGSLLGAIDDLDPSERQQLETSRAEVLTFLADNDRTDLDKLVDSEFVVLILDEPDLAADPEVVEAIEFLHRTATTAHSRFELYAFDDPTPAPS